MKFKAGDVYKSNYSEEKYLILSTNGSQCYYVLLMSGQSLIWYNYGVVFGRDNFEKL